MARYYRSACYDIHGQHGVCGPDRVFSGRTGGWREVNAYNEAMADCLGWMLSPEGKAATSPGAANPCCYVGVEAGGGATRFAVLHCERFYVQYLTECCPDWGTPLVRRDFLAAAERRIRTGRPSFFTR